MLSQTSEKAMTNRTFQGFSRDTVNFLHELEENNERAWFEANRERYQLEVVQPAQAFVLAMNEPLHSDYPVCRPIPGPTVLARSFAFTGTHASAATSVPTKPISAFFSGMAGRANANGPATTYIWKATVWLSTADFTNFPVKSC